MLTLITADEQGFLPASNEHVATFNAFPRDSVANVAPPAPPLHDFDVREDLFTAPAPYQFVAGFHHLLGRLAMTESGVQRAQHVGSTREADERRQAHKTEVTWGMPREQLRQRHQAQRRTLRPMPSGVEGPGQVVEGPPMTPHRFFSPLARAPSMVPHGPPPGINTDCK